MTNPQKRVMYMERLPKEVGALLDGNGLVGLTEINRHWYRWLTTEFAGNGTCPSFAAGQKWRHRHDGNDCAIFWDSEIVQELNWNPWTLCYASHDIPADSVAAKYDWRGFMSVEFQSVAPPHVRFIAAIVHNPRGQKKMALDKRIWEAEIKQKMQWLILRCEGWKSCCKSHGPRTVSRP